MKLSTFALVTVAGMGATSVGVWSTTKPQEPASHAPVTVPAPAPDPAPDRAAFQVGDTLMMEGRLGHPVVPSTTSSETFLYVDVTADASKQAAAAAPLALAIVIDRSGSMQKRMRLDNALDAARTAIGRLRDGDIVSVIAYNTMSDVIVPPTVVTSATRADAIAKLKTIRSKGDTCISCGVETAMRLLSGNESHVTQILLLSDGEATAGVRDVPGLERIAESCRSMGMAITTIGVDIEYNERIMAAMARTSNGRHYFVDRPERLASIFDEETEALAQTLARKVELTVDVAPGVTIDHVFDRAFERKGDRLVVPLGTFARNERKSLLVRLRVPRGPEGDRAIAGVKLSYEDLAKGTSRSCEGELAAIASADPKVLSDLDGIVAGRLTQAETADALEEANLLATSGRTAEAREVIERQRRAAGARRAHALSKPTKRKDDIMNAFGKSDRALGGADRGFGDEAKPEATGSQTRANQKEAFDLDR